MSWKTQLYQISNRSLCLVVITKPLMLNQHQPLTTMITFALLMFQCSLLRTCLWQLKNEYMNFKINSVSIMQTKCMLHTRRHEITKFYTGFPSFQILCATFQVIQPTAAKMSSWSQLQRLRNKGTEEVDQLRAVN